MSNCQRTVIIDDTSKQIKIFNMTRIFTIVLLLVWSSTCAIAETIMEEDNNVRKKYKQIVYV
jgi:hypothetical protein